MKEEGRLSSELQREMMREGKGYLGLRRMRESGFVAVVVGEVAEVVK